MSYECEICGRVFDSASGKGVHRGAAHSDDEIKAVIRNTIQRVANIVDKTPTAGELEGNSTLSVSTVKKYYESWNEAVEAAGLVVNERRDVPDEELLEELTRLADEQDGSPRVYDMDQEGRFAPSTYSERFGSWNEALEAAGLELNKQQDIPESDLLEELHRLKEKFDRAPTVEEMREHGQFEPNTYHSAFGSWNQSLRKAGLEINKQQDIPEAELIDELQRLEQQLGYTPTAPQMDTVGGFDSTTYASKFGSWNEAVRAADLEPTARHGIPESELIAELRRVRDELDRTPKAQDMEAQGEFGKKTYHQAFGSWNDALAAADLEPIRRQDITDAELLAEIERLAEEFNRAPYQKEMWHHGKFSSGVYGRRFGSWTAALIEAGFEPNGVLNPEHLDHTVRSRWEQVIAELLVDAGISYEYESLEISYGDGRTYTPDFVTADYVIEVKGRLYRNAKQKAMVAVEQLDDRDYVVVGTKLPADIHIAWEDHQQLRQLF